METRLRIINFNSIILVPALLLFSIVATKCNISKKDTLGEKLDYKRANCDKQSLSSLANYYGTNKDISYKAALFLSDNMRHHYFYHSQLLDSLSQVYDFLNGKDSTWKSNNLEAPRVISSVYDSFYISATEFNENVLYESLDCAELDTDFFTNNIDHSVATWKTFPWRYTVGIDTFLNYVLPYRCGREPITPNWRSILREEYASWIDSMYLDDDILTAAQRINGNLHIIQNWGIENYPIPRSIEQLIKGRIGVCDDLVHLGLHVLRSAGFPTAWDYVPQWANLNIGHSWLALIAKDTTYAFDAKYNTPILFNDGRTPAKIYRRMYAIQENSIMYDASSDELIPSTLKDFYIRDVTSEYVSTSDVSITIGDTIPERALLYICVFQRDQLFPIHWGKVDGNNAIFKDMGTGVVYVIAYYNNHKRLIPITDPFVLGNHGELKYFSPEIEFTSLTVTRKYPMKPSKLLWSKSMRGGKFYGAKKHDLSDSVLLNTIITNPGQHWQQIHVKDSKPYQYYFYKSSSSHESYLAEVEYLFDEQILVGKPFGSKQWKGKDFDAVYDGSKLSYFGGTGFTAGLALEKPKRVNKIKFIARNDDNGIRKGDRYQLLFWQDSHWNQFQTATAYDTALTFSMVPKNALYLLRNITRGSEERIFTYDQDHQVWW